MAIMQAKLRLEETQQGNKTKMLCLMLAACTLAPLTHAQMIGAPKPHPAKGAESLPGGSGAIDGMLDSSAANPVLNGLAAGGTSNTAASYQIIGYYPSWSSASYPVSNINPAQLSVINYAFLNLCWNGKQGNPAPDGGGQIACKAGTANGALVLGDAGSDAANLKALVNLKNLNRNLKIIPSVGGWTWSNQFSNMAASSATRNNFIESTLALIRQYKLDGIDIDWEYPTQIGIPCASGNTCQRSSDKKNFVLLAQALRTAFDEAGKTDGKHYLITIAAGASRDYVNDAGNGSGWIKNLAASLDWVNLMTYDFHGPWDQRSGHVAPLYADAADNASTGLNADASVKLYLAAGVPAGKLVLGMPFYGYGWKGCAAGTSGSGQYQACQGTAQGSSGATFDFNYLLSKGLLVKDASGKYSKGAKGYARYWNASARVPYLYNASTQTFITYDDEASVHEKNLYIKAKGLKGAMFWELNADKNQLLNSIISNELPH